MVCVSCMTYNHAPFIKDAMTGFCMQKTDFPYVCTIIDDASTDGEPEIIKRYLEDNFNIKDRSLVWNKETDDFLLSFARHKTNTNCYFAVLFLKYNHYRKKSKLTYVREWRDSAKYIAMCEGDDYWCDEMKLQRQVDFMEQHEYVSIYTHNALIKYPDGNSKLFNKKLSTGKYGLSRCLYMGWFTPTASYLYRNNITVSPLWLKNGSNGDMAILFSNLLKGDLFYLDKVMSVYKYSSNASSMSASTPRSVLYKKKRGMLKTINQLSNNKYIWVTLPLIFLSFVKQTIWNILKWLHLK